MSADLNRYLQPAIQADLADKMVLLAGPRQVGKTTLARRVLHERGAGSLEVSHRALTHWMDVEAKLSETQVDPAVVHFKERFSRRWSDRPRGPTRRR